MTARRDGAVSARSVPVRRPAWASRQVRHGFPAAKTVCPEASSAALMLQRSAPIHVPPLGRTMCE